MQETFYTQRTKRLAQKNHPLFDYLFGTYFSETVRTLTRNPSNVAA